MFINGVDHRYRTRWVSNWTVTASPWTCRRWTSPRRATSLDSRRSSGNPLHLSTVSPSDCGRFISLSLPSRWNGLHTNGSLFNEDRGLQFSLPVRTLVSAINPLIQMMIARGIRSRTSYFKPRSRALRPVHPSKSSPIDFGYRKRST